jgi:hypothetical protein
MDEDAKAILSIHRRIAMHLTAETAPRAGDRCRKAAWAGLTRRVGPV